VSGKMSRLVALSPRIHEYSSSVQRIQDAHNGRGEITDEDFKILAITDCMKTYWRNIHKQFRL
jgi:hypothetical protein